MIHYEIMRNNIKKVLGLVLVIMIVLAVFAVSNLFKQPAAQFIGEKSNVETSVNTITKQTSGGSNSIDKTIEDTTPPTFTDLTINPKSISNGGIIKVNFSVNDDLSGFQIGSVNWINPNNETIWGWTIGERLAELPIKIEVSPYLKKGIYHIDISLTDKAGNRKDYHGNTDFDGRVEIE